MPVLSHCLLPFVLMFSAVWHQSEAEIQDAAPAPEPPPAAVEPDETLDETPVESNAAADDDAAAVRALLLAARRFQRGDRPLPRPSSLHGLFHVRLRQDDGSMFKADVERWYTRAPERLITTSTERVTGSTTTVCWNEATAWFRDEKTKEVVLYTDSPDVYEVDLELLQQQLELTQLLLDASVLDALVPRLVGAHLTGTRTITDLDGGEHEVTLLTARVSDPVYARALGAPAPADGEPPLVLELELGIEASTGTLWELRVPGNIKVFRADDPLERIGLGVGIDDDDYYIFDVDTSIDAARFAVPSAR
ncbi:MAG: hypothetical protein ACYTG2_18625 [Planctomycetota bacterium]|jgi:hypothetical protein